MTKEREKVELSIGWDTSFYNEEVIKLASVMNIPVMIAFLIDVYNTTNKLIEDWRHTYNWSHNE